MRRLTPEGMSHLAAIRTLRDKKRRQERKVDATRDQIAELVRQGFDKGVPIQKMAQAAGLSLARIYQYRDGK